MPGGKNLQKKVQRCSCNKLATYGVSLSQGFIITYFGRLQYEIMSAKPFVKWSLMKDWSPH